MADLNKRRSRKTKLVPRQCEDEMQVKSVKTIPKPHIEFDIKVEIESCDEDFVITDEADQAIKTEDLDDDDMFEAEENDINKSILMLTRRSSLLISQNKAAIINDVDTTIDDDNFGDEENDINNLATALTASAKRKRVPNIKKEYDYSIDDDDEQDIATLANMLGGNDAKKLVKQIVNNRKTHLKVSEDLLLRELDRISNKFVSVADKMLDIEMRNLWGRFRYVKHEYTKQEKKLAKIWRNWCKGSNYKYPPAMYKCYVCEKAWWHLYPFKEHLNGHEEDDLKVDIEVSFSQCCIVAWFFKSVTKKFPVEGNCWRCGKDVENHTINHSKKDNKYTCSYCCVGFHNCQLMREHESVCLTKYIKGSRQNDSIAMFTCTICTYKALDKKVLEKHMEIYHVVRSDLLVPGYMGYCCACSEPYSVYHYHSCPLRNPNFNCTYCSKRFQTRATLNDHYKNNKENIKCRVCNMTVPMKCQEVEHMVTHSTTFMMMYKCLTCVENILFLNKHSLKKHWSNEHKQGFDRRRNYSEKVLVLKEFIMKHGVGPLEQACSPVHVAGKSQDHESNGSLDHHEIEQDDDVVFINPQKIQVIEIDDDDDDENVIKYEEKVLNSVNSENICEKVNHSLLRENHEKEAVQVKVENNKHVDVGDDFNIGKNGSERVNDLLKSHENTTIKAKVINKQIDLKIVNSDQNYGDKVISNLNSHVKKTEVEGMNIKNDLKISNNDETDSNKEIPDLFNSHEKKTVQIKIMNKQHVLKKANNDKKYGKKGISVLKSYVKENEQVKDLNNENDDLKIANNDKSNRYKVICDLLNSHAKDSLQVKVLNIEQNDLNVEKNDENDSEKVDQDLLRSHDETVQVKQEKSSDDEMQDFSIETSLLNIKKEEETEEVYVVLSEVLHTNPSSSLDSTVKKELEQGPIEKPEKVIYDCVICAFKGPQFQMKKHMRQHKVDNVKKGDSYNCSKCNLTFKRIKLYSVHLNNHGYEPKSCPECMAVFQHFSLLERHIKVRTKAMLVRQQFFMKKNKSGSQLVIKHQCRKCKQNVSLKDTFSHWESHLEVKDLIKFSGDNEINSNLEEAHTEGNTTHGEGNEGEDIGEGSGFSYHIQDSRSEPLGPDVIKKLIAALLVNKGEKECVLCERVFDRRNDTKRHLIEHLLGDAYLNKYKTNSLKCQICHDGFQKSDQYKFHMRTHGGLPVYQCYMCGKNFSDSSNFTKHKKIHDMYIHSCFVCGKKFISKGMLDKHVKMHEITGPFKCAHCPVVCYTETSHHRHVKTVHQKTKYRCVICKKRFNSIRERWDHEWVQHRHRKQPADCPVCGQGFRKVSDLRAHVQELHEVDYVVLNNLLSGKELEAYKCKDCNIILSTQDLLDDHVLNRHNV